MDAVGPFTAEVVCANGVGDSRDDDRERGGVDMGHIYFNWKYIFS